MALSSWRRRRRTPPLPPATTDASSSLPPATSSSPRGVASPPPPAPTAAAAAATAPTSPASTSPPPLSTSPRNVLAFWLLGLANNSPYTIALAAANELAAGAVGSVFFSAVFPALLLKLTAPFWFPRVPVGVRAAAAALMALTAFPLLAAATATKKGAGAAGGAGGAGGAGAGEGSGPAISPSSVLASIALLSLQGGLGEASALAAAGSYPRPRVVLGAWSSGTGAAGPVGFSFLMLFHVFAKLSLRATMLLALFWPALWLVAHFAILEPPPPPQQRDDAEGEGADAAAAAGEEREGAVLVVGGGATAATAGTIELSPLSSASSRPLSAASASAAAKKAKAEALDPEEATGLLTPRAAAEAEEDEEEDEERGGAKTKQGAAAAAAAAAAATALPSSSSSSISAASPRWAATSLPTGFLATSTHVASLWPFAVPLFLVYFAEYVCQAGVWSALGGPDPAKRDRFYKYANWLYQAGVFLSRTFGGWLRLSRGQLWLLPCAQGVFLALFVAAGASAPSWAETLAPGLLPFPLLLAPAFAVGLLGGLGYVATFSLLAESIPFAPLRQISLAAVSVADSAGIALADAVSVLVQGCLYRAAGIPGAAFECGLG